MKTEDLQLGNNKSAETEIEARLDNIVQVLFINFSIIIRRVLW
jgi:hypothetical protein